MPVTLAGCDILNMAKRHVVEAGPESSGQMPEASGNGQSCAQTTQRQLEYRGDRPHFRHAPALLTATKTARSSNILRSAEAGGYLNPFFPCLLPETVDASATSWSEPNNIEHAKKQFLRREAVLSGRAADAQSGTVGPYLAFYLHDGGMFCVTEPINGEPGHFANGGTGLASNAIRLSRYRRSRWQWRSGQSIGRRRPARARAVWAAYLAYARPGWQ